MKKVLYKKKITGKHMLCYYLNMIFDIFSVYFGPFFSVEMKYIIMM